VKDLMTPEQLKKCERAAILQLDKAQEAFTDQRRVSLIICGWKETCETPGALWLWTKRITLTRRYREPELINMGDGLDWVKNPKADEWSTKTITYDALCDVEMAITIETRLQDGRK
jgi:hypothetical protein